MGRLIRSPYDPKVLGRVVVKKTPANHIKEFNQTLPRIGRKRTQGPCRRCESVHKPLDKRIERLLYRYAYAIALSLALTDDH